jgi:Escherichia/Staphylococcus phage prohead protease
MITETRSPDDRPQTVAPAVYDVRAVLVIAVAGRDSRRHRTSTWSRTRRYAPFGDPMTNQTLHRSMTIGTVEGRRVYGRLVPFGQVAEVSDGAGRYKERFAPGSFRRSIAERGAKIRLLVGHDDRRLPIGKATLLEERVDGLFGEFLVAATRDGDDALAAIAAGLVDSFSIGFRPIKSDYDADGVTVRTEVALREVSLVTFPAYEGAAIAGVRSDSRQLPRAAALRRLTHLRKGTS